MATTAGSRWANRGLDRLWFWFCVIHIPISLLFDVSCLYPAWVLARTPVPGIVATYIQMTRDPIMKGAVFGPEGDWGWLRTLILLEGAFQVPCFAVGAVGLWRNDPRVWPLLLAYGASAATSMVPVTHAVFTYPTQPPLSTSELAIIMGTYGPWLVIPLGMALHMASRILAVLKRDQVAQLEKKAF